MIMRDEIQGQYNPTLQQREQGEKERRRQMEIQEHELILREPFQGEKTAWKAS